MRAIQNTLDEIEELTSAVQDVTTDSKVDDKKCPVCDNDPEQV